jgi:HTH-type transcriptional regulator/antitoxin HigA
MIKNAKQFGVSKRQIAKLKDALEISMKYPAEMDQRIYEAMIAGIESQIQDIQKEIDEYEKLQRDKDIPIGTLENIGEFLIKARIVSGYTQKELAEKVGIASQAIQQYEAKEYKSINLGTLKKITEALGVNGVVELVMQKDSLVKENVLGVWNINKINTQPDDPIEVSYDSDWFRLQKVA